MIKGKRVLAVIPARGGSKGVPRKNIREVGGKPLIAWTIEAAQKSKYVDRLILSSEDEEIIRVAKSWNCEVPFVRPLSLAQDTTPGIEPLLHAIEEVSGFDYVMLLQPTSPLRSTEDIDRCLEKCLQMDAPSCVSVTIPDKSPYWMYSLNEEQKLNPLLPVEISGTRQELPKVYVLNGALYVATVSFIKKSRSLISPDTIAYVMPKERSLDIDSESDIQMFEIFMKTKCYDE
jgi:CMP-N,N'-diacetyllegionaminic acid synthase